MIDKSLLKNSNIGKDGFTWWLGQVCEAKVWKDNYPCLPVDTLDELPGFKRRVKVSILGWHTSDKNELKNDELPWAYCLLPVTAGGGTGGSSESLNFTGGEWVFGFFLDGDDGQQPVIIGVLDKSTQEDFRSTVPPVRYKPFSGFTNERVQPLTDKKKDATVSKESVGEPDVAEGNTGVFRTRTKPTESTGLEQGAKGDVRPKAELSRYNNAKATGDMTAADNSDAKNPFASTEKAMRRLSRMETWIKTHNNIPLDGNAEKLAGELLEKEKKRAARISAGDQKTQTNKMRAATLEAASKMMSNIATFGKMADLDKIKEANAGGINNIIGQFTGMIDQLPLNASNFINQSANKVINQPPCVTESYIGGLIGQNIGALDGTMNSLMGPVNTALETATSGDFPPNMKDTINGMLTGGLNAFGGISVNLDGLTTFSTSYKKLMQGEKPIPATKVKDLNILSGSKPESALQSRTSSILEEVAAKVAGGGQLAMGSSNFLNNNSLFSTDIITDNFNMERLGGLGKITDTLSLAKNLPQFKEFPGSTAQSILNSTRQLLESGNTLDTAMIAAETIFPGGREFVKQAFNNQVEGERFAGGGCETGPTLNGPPRIRVFGGNGNGVTANAVVGPNGNLLAIQLTRPGKGFTEVPFVVIEDNSGRGRGAIAKAVLDYDNPTKDRIPVQGLVQADGSRKDTIKTVISYPIKDIDVIEPGTGYMQAPDGSIGGNGRVYASGNDTLIKDKEGNYYQFEPGTGIKIPPGGTVYLPAGTSTLLPTNTVKTDGENLVPPTGSNIIDYAAIQYMHNFDVSGGKIIPGKQGAEGPGKPGFGAGTDLPAAREAGFKDHDIRFFLEGDPARGQKTAGVSGYFVRHMNGAIGRNMQKLLDDPSWGPLPVMNSAGKKPGKIKSIQINVKKGFKGFAKVTDGSRLGAGPILSLRDAVTDRKISNILEFQTGNWLNQKEDLQGNTEILSLFKEQELRAINGTPVEQFGRFGTAGTQTWEQTKLGAEGSRVSIDKNNKNYQGEEEWVRKWYKENLCREPDPEGLRHWVKDLNSGRTRAQVAEDMKIATPEYAKVQADRASGKIKPEKCQWQGRILGGGARKDVNGQNWRTLDPWRADYPDGTRLKFRGVYNHNTGMSKEQYNDPYNITLNNYRYFIFDYEVEVYSTPQGYSYALGMDTVKNKWYKLVDLHFVTGTEDWFNGETIKKRCLDKAGRLYEMYITVCTYDDDKAEAIGAGLGTAVESTEVLKTPLPCEPEIRHDQHADYMKTRWYREKIGNDGYNEDWGHIPGTERNELTRDLVKIYNSFSEKGYSYKEGRKFVDQKGLNHWIKRYLYHLKEEMEGRTCEMEKYKVKQYKTVMNAVVGWGGPGVYLDLRGLIGPQTITLREVIDDSGIHHSMDIPGVAEISEQGLNWGKTAKVVTVQGGRIYGPITSQTAAGVWIGTENPPHIKKNDLPSQLRNPRVCMVEEMGDDFDDFGVSTNVGHFSRFNKNPFSETTVETGTITKKRRKRCTPLTLEQYESFKNNLNQKPSLVAWNCTIKEIYAAAKEAFKDQGKITKEQQYCDWAREYVEEIRTTFRPSKTIGYELPCGGIITAPTEEPEIPPGGGTPLVVKPKAGIVNSTGSGYQPSDKILMDGKEVPFETDPFGRITSFGLTDDPVLDYPEIQIISEYGTGADLEVLLGVEEPPEDPELLPLKMVEVIDCVGKNIFIKES